jgi:hypothetical protein
MQQWEYMTFIQRRGWRDREKDGPFSFTGAWNPDILPELPKLGKEGWELVSVVAQSSVVGGWEVSTMPKTSIALDYAGLTTERLWVFKRPLD